MGGCGRAGHINPGEDGVCTVAVMSQVEHTVELPVGITVVIMEPVVSSQNTDPNTGTGGIMTSVSE